MPKKNVKREDNSASERENKKETNMKSPSLEEKLIENLVILQKVHTDLAEKFNKLSEQIASLLNLFEMSARSFAQNPANLASEKDREFLEKIDRLLEQNKTIAKGLTLMEEKIRERTYSNFSPSSENKEEYSLSSERSLPKF